MEALETVQNASAVFIDRKAHYFQGATDLELLWATRSVGLFVNLAAVRGSSVLPLLRFQRKLPSVTDVHDHLQGVTAVNQWL